MTVEPELAALADAHGRGEPYRFRGTGTSMWPALRPGDVALAEPLGETNPRAGEICLYVVRDDAGLSSHLIAHRYVMTLADGSHSLRGDAMPHADPPVATADLVARVVGIERHGVRVASAGRLTLTYRAALGILHARAPRLTRVLRVLGRLTAPGARG